MPTRNLIDLLLLIFICTCLIQCDDKKETHTTQNEIAVLENKPIQSQSQTKNQNSNKMDTVDISPVEDEEYLVRVNGKDFIPKVSTNYRLVLDSVKTVSDSTVSDRKIRNSIYYDNQFLYTKSGKFYYKGGKIYNQLNEPLSKNAASLSPQNCGREAGIEFGILEDGSGLVSNCDNYIRIHRMENGLFPRYPNDIYWEILLDKDIYKYNFTKYIFFTEDGMFMYALVQGDPYFLRKYNMDTKQLIWEKSMEENRVPHHMTISPDNQYIIVNRKHWYDKDWNLIKQFEKNNFSLNKDVDRPFFIENYGFRKSLCVGNNKIWLISLDGAHKTEYIYMDNAKSISFGFIHKDRFVFNAKLYSKKNVLYEINLQNFEQISIVEDSIGYTDNSSAFCYFNKRDKIIIKSSAEELSYLSLQNIE